MATLLLDELPRLRYPAVVAAFTGWPDAGEAGSGALAYLIRTLGARRFASIDPELFYVFGEARPSTLLLGDEQRVLSWPTSEFFAARDPSGRDLVLLLGREPNVRWREYVATVLELTERVGGGPLFTLGGTYDRVSHRMAATISAWAPTPELRHTLTSLGVRFSNYEGPSSIQSALIDCCVERRIAAASLWGHVPHYVSGTPNPKVVQALLQHLSALLGLQVDLGPLDVAARELDEQIEQALQGREDVQAYVRQIEAHAADEWQAIVPWEGTPGPLQSAESIIEELDTFLRELREDDEGATE